MQVQLKVETGSHAGKLINVSSTKFLIGRGDQCQLRPKSESVSRRHCILAQRDNRLLVQDLGSRNGTFVNGKQLPTDRAKVLKHGDHLRVGKLEFEILLEPALGGAKRPEVKDVKDAASRTVEAAGSEDSRFVDVDINAWLEEADQIDRNRKLTDPETRQLRLDETQQVTPPKKDSGEISVESESSDTGSKSGERKRPEKRPPGKLPKVPKSQLGTDSREAAGDALKRFFSGR